MTIQLTSHLLVHQNVLVDPLKTDLDRKIPAQPPRNLLRAPIQTQLRFDLIPCFWQDTIMAMIATTKRLVMSLLRPVASQPTITFQLSTDGGFVLPYHYGDFCLIVTHFQQSRNLVSLSLGKLCVSHKHSFDLAVFRGLSYRSLPLSTIKVALVS
jgi:hypothetical protein